MIKYTRNNVSDICAKYLDLDPVTSKNLGLVTAVQQTGIRMFLNNIPPEDDEAKLVRQSLTNLIKTGYFSFEPE